MVVIVPHGLQATGVLHQQAQQLQADIQAIMTARYAAQLAECISGIPVLCTTHARVKCQVCVESDHRDCQTQRKRLCMSLVWPCTVDSCIRFRCQILYMSIIAAAMDSYLSAVHAFLKCPCKLAESRPVTVLTDGILTHVRAFTSEQQHPATLQPT